MDEILYYRKPKFHVLLSAQATAGGVVSFEFGSVPGTGIDVRKIRATSVTAVTDFSERDMRVYVDGAEKTLLNDRDDLCFPVLIGDEPTDVELHISSVKKLTFRGTGFEANAYFKLHVYFDITND